jgi:tRNA(Ile)-lysidine synthase
LLATTRAEVEAYLAAIGQHWREDSSNRHLTFTRNRIRHELLPLLEDWNPRLREHLTQMAQLARDEEAWWTFEVAKVAGQLLLHGRPVRGGGREAGDGLALDVIRLAALAPALQRRLLRFAADELGVDLDFPATEALRTLALVGRAGQRLELVQGLRAERTAKELRLAILPVVAQGADEAAEYTVAIPGEVAAFGLRLRIEVTEPAMATEGQTAKLRNWKPGDRVQSRYSSGPRKVKEVLERLKVTGSSRAFWPVLELEGRVIWMRGVVVEPAPGTRVVAVSLEDDDVEPSRTGN